MHNSVEPQPDAKQKKNHRIAIEIFASVWGICLPNLNLFRVNVTLQLGATGTQWNVHCAKIEPNLRNKKTTPSLEIIPIAEHPRVKQSGEND